MCGSCGRGVFLLLGVEQGDTEADALRLAEKIVKLRIFYDENGVKNLSLVDMGGEALVVSNFTLCANYRTGNRPDYHLAAPPETAKPLYEHFTALLAARLPRVETGIFGAYMQISADFDGPVTLVLESDVLAAPRKS